MVNINGKLNILSYICFSVTFFFSLIIVVGCGGGGGGGSEGIPVVVWDSSLEGCLYECAFIIGPFEEQRTCRFQCYAFYGYPAENDSSPDVSAPSTPTNLLAEAISYNQVNLTWNQSTDNEPGILRYEVLKNGEKFFIALTKTETSDMPTIRSSTNNCYAVLSCDSSDNCSSPGAEVCVLVPENPHLKWSSTIGVYLSNIIVTTGGTIYGSHQTSYMGSTLYSINANGTLKWSYPNINLLDIYKIGNNGTVYTRSSNDENLLAIEVDGTLRWSYNTGDKFTNPFLSKEGNDIIYVGSGDKLLSINGDGTLRWSSDEFSNPVVDSIRNNGTIYIKSKVDNAVVFNAINAIDADGTLKWGYKTGIFSTLLSGSDDTIYFLRDNTLVVLNKDGSLKWSFAITDYDFPLYNLKIGNDGTAYLYGGPDETLHAINTNGSLKWSYYIGNSATNPSPLIGDDGIIYVGSGEKLLAINGDGTLRWSYSTEGIQALNYYLTNPYSVLSLYGFTAEVSPAIIDRYGTIYAGIAGTLLAINPNGTLNWSYTTESYSISTPVIDINGTLYIGSYDNNLYALQQ